MAVIEKYGTAIPTSLLHLSSSQSYDFLESANNRRASCNKVHLYFYFYFPFRHGLQEYVYFTTKRC